jgi:hypothetical protein
VSAAKKSGWGARASADPNDNWIEILVDGLPFDEDAGERELEKSVLSDINRRRARKLRPKTRATHRSETIEAMRPWRAGGSTLDDFIDHEEHDRVTIRPGGSKGYIVECDYIFDHKGVSITSIEVSLRRLLDWWVEAGK